MSKTEETGYGVDPVVEEVRRAGEELARKAGYDLHRLCEHLREAERRHPERLARPTSTRPRAKTQQ